MAGNDIYFIAVALGNRPEGRIRFDMAHELGHILLHPWSEDLEAITKMSLKQENVRRICLRVHFCYLETALVKTLLHILQI